MSFQDISDLKFEYHTTLDDVVDDFYLPVLKEAKTYKRAVGFFSSNALLEISIGLSTFVKHNHGKIQLLISPKLDKEDYEAIKKGYDEKKYLEQKMINSFDESTDFPQKEDRFGLLSHLIATGVLSIKIVAMRENSNTSMFHEKLGILYDNKQDIVAFSGSANETENGWARNFENIDVFCSWKNEMEYDRCQAKDMMFDELWDDQGKSTITIPFPEVIKQKLLRFDSPDKDYSHLDSDLLTIFRKQRRQENSSHISGPRIPEGTTLRSYQTNAIETWASRGFRGIYDMATGTGKTLTGLGSVVKLFETKKKLFVIICCPYVHLIDQWAEDCKSFNINPIICYGFSKVYLKELSDNLLNFGHGRLNFVCAIVTNIGFANEEFQRLIFPYLQETLLLVDEAHNFGADRTSTTMKNNFAYRLALSATIERYGDEEGTKKLFDFFGSRCITYSLKDAITNGNLCHYFYYPIPVFLTEEETEKYYSLSNQIAKYHLSLDSELPPAAKRLLLRRARLIAGARNKIDALIETIKPFRREHNMLIYCGAVKYGDDDYDKATDEKKQIALVENRLYTELGMDVSKFTSQEDAETRRAIITLFKEKQIQALVAIKCLDEGVNVPAIQRAFILASSTNPKEYIQRRGRVLRTYPGKKYAYIYDFVNLINPSLINNEKERRFAANLAVRELARWDDFANLSDNPSESNEKRDIIVKDYGLSQYHFNEEDLA